MNMRRRLNFTLCVILSLLLGQTVSGARAREYSGAREYSRAAEQADGEAAEYWSFIPVVTRYLGFRESTGVLDPSFGEDGVVTTSFLDNGAVNALVVQGDGKIIAAGWVSDVEPEYQQYVALARYNPDGSLDTTFDGDGKVSSNFSGIFEAEAVALQPDGKIVVAGDGLLAYSLFFLARYNPDGSLDSSFGIGGWLTTDFYGDYNYANAVAIQPDGMILVGGSAYQGVISLGGQSDFALARYNPDGSLDSTFDGDGKVTTDFAGKSESGNSLALQPDGKILLTGMAAECPYYCFALARYNPDGSLDTSFDGDGLATADLGIEHNYAEAMALQPDGKIVMGGINRESILYHNIFALIRFNPNGDVDWDFGTWGKTLTDWGEPATANAILRQPQGKIILAGYASSVTSLATSFAMARYNPDGSLDESFGSGGLYWTEVTGHAYAAALQPDGKIVLGGSLQGDLILARFK